MENSLISQVSRRELRDSDLTGVALCLYDDPAESIRLIGERVVPALNDA